MNESTKKPWLSRTIIINSIMGLSMALVPFIPAMAGVKTFIESNAITIGAIWSVLNIVLRAISKDKISLQD